MKTLVYTVAHGDPVYFELAQELVSSARRRGYAGEMAVFTDRAWNFEGAWSRTLERGEEILWKAAPIHAMGAAEMAGYDRMLFLDADCRLTKHPTELFAWNGIGMAIQGGLAGRYNTVFLSPGEKARARAERLPDFNSGAFVMPGAAARDFLERWERCWRGCPRAELAQGGEYAWRSPLLMDQPALHALLLRERIDCRPFPRPWMGFPLYAQPSAEAVVLHFCGPLGGKGPRDNKIRLLKRMRAAETPDKV